MMIYVQGPQTTVLVDPDFAAIWQRSPYAEELERLAREAEASGGYVILFVGDDVFKIEPAPDAGPESGGRHERLAAAACAG
ncbi:MAG TPA: hypothetical protein VHG11_11100 [Pseudorhizobium sp.]|nr:hypothetical protein [Pseudorhizobium sp.]